MAHYQPYPVPLAAMSYPSLPPPPSLPTHPLPTLILSSTALALSLLLTATSLTHVLRARLRLRRRGTRAQVTGPEAPYRDEDGGATRDSEEVYARWLLAKGVLLLVGAVVGTGVGGVRAVAGTLGERERGVLGLVGLWLAAGIWLPLITQAILVLVEKDPVRKYEVALNNSISYIIVTALFCYVNGFIGQDRVNLGLSIAEVALAVVGFFLCASFPRRPDVFLNGRPVDRQKSASALSRYSYSWLTPLLSFASKRQVLRQDDIPKLDSARRARDLHDAYVSKNYTGRLWKSVIKAHAPALVLQYILGTLESLLIVVPQIAMFHLLKLLEARQQGANVTLEASLWVVGLGIGILIQNFFENWRWWVSYGHLNVPIRVQLSALIFSKAMRRKDVKSAETTHENNSNVIGAVATSSSGPEEVAGKKNTEEAAADPTAQKTEQGTINLVGVDSKRIADFATYQNGFYGAFLKITVSFVFIYKLVGWQALIAGIIAQLLTVPLNLYFTKRYASAQNDLMTARDRKLAVLNEALTGIRQIKFSALEKQWQAKIQEFRETELKTIWRVFVSDTFLIFCWIFGPYMLSAVTLATHAIVHDHLYPSVAFTTIGILTQIEGTLAFIPELIASGLDSWVSINRIEEYLNAPEKENNTEPGDRIAFKDASVAWPSNAEKNEEAFVLRDLDFSFPEGELSVISGRTGSGKTLLLKAILGEVDIISGTIEMPQAPPHDQRFDWKATKKDWIIPAAIAFVSQQPWIENCNFRDNVLFGLPFDSQRYRKVISACALEKDLEMLTDGDITEIGAQGINLSGGQRWRITLARALYSRAGILVLDDIFSAVDAHVGKHIFEKALTGELGQGRTRIIVTHHVAMCLSRTKFEVLLEAGRVEKAGLVDELRSSGDIETILEEENLEDEATETATDLLEVPNGNGHHGGRRRSSHSKSNALSRQRSHSSIRSDALIDNGHLDVNSKYVAKKFVEEETKQRGHVLWNIYLRYVRAGGGYWLWGGIVFAFMFVQALILGRSWWLTIWTSQYKTESSAEAKPFTAMTFQHPMAQRALSVQTVSRDTRFYVAVYLLISVALSTIGALRYFWVYCGSIRASRKLFDDLTYAVLRAPLRWLDTVPTGRVLNRFTADFSTLDLEQANAFSFMVFNFLMVVGIVIAGMMVTPIMVIFAVLLLALCLRYSLFYLAGARETKRLESLAKSPVFELFGAALSGISTIRAFDKSDSYIENMFAKIDAHGQTVYYMWSFNRWLTFRLGVVGAVFTVAMAALIVSLGNIDASLAGFALGFTLDYSISVVFMLRQYAVVELSMNAVERIVEYSDLEIENEGGEPAPAAWPAEGRLEVENLVVSYAPDLDPVLKGVNFSVAPNERVGIVGRTGAGKSSLTLALFRFLEAQEGRIVIDGLDISKIRLHDLRSRLAIIPQDPVLFSGTIRSNLDPFGEHEDRDLHEVLARVHLTDGPPHEYSNGDGLALIPPTTTRSVLTHVFPHMNPAHNDAASTHSGSSSHSSHHHLTEEEERELFTHHTGPVTVPELEAIFGTPPSSPSAGSDAGAEAEAAPLPSLPPNFNPFTNLSYPIAPAGANLSQGQRQLLCLARALLARPKVMILDEATSAVDKATDARIQASVRAEFGGRSTLLVIAHRLSTIADFDRVVVVGEGRVVETGSPRELLLREEGVFRGMVEGSGEKEGLWRVILGEGEGEE
ncbi:uncharacterized protein K452DRAFT_351715 [Aplosporella prunicola CBS 121167]|uniref:ABC bile acid transporter n=1 Tax=Aplosporella prunicola CBS 121167 TaxID=1176127 RepID=A0A6A6BCN9_9PEZI|nr:uncharacterized protein K452DRAFT_351715 [Aplosporella prunicola CBS 121167]KAF2141055.1 hypothetical protein K452DRAFT_351715 [Aplosporella prunicola CBS 121167]